MARMHPFVVMSLEMKKAIKISSTDDGLLLNDYILSFDSLHSENVSFLSSAVDPYIDVSARIICTEETIRILNTFKRKPNALVCQNHHPFSVGKLTIELLPSGGVLGASSLYVSMEDYSLLYAPLLRSDSFLGLRSFRLKKADTLVVRALHCPTIRLRRSEEIQRLLSRVEDLLSKGIPPIIFCSPVGGAQELTHYLSQREVPLSLHSSIFKVHKVYESFGCKLGSYKQFSKSSARDSVVLLPSTRYLSSSLKLLENRPKLRLENDYRNLGVFGMEDTFYWNMHANFEELRKDIFPKVAPKKLYFYGPYSKAYERHTKASKRLTTVALYQNRQPSLF